MFNHLSANPTKRSNTIKQFVGNKFKQLVSHRNKEISKFLKIYKMKQKEKKTLKEPNKKKTIKTRLAKF